MSKNVKGLAMMALSAAVMALLLSACSSPTPEAAATTVPAAAVATEAPAVTEAATEKPTEAATEAATEASAATDSVAADDQKLGDDKTLTIAKVVAAADGWIVIHADKAGPGAVLGYAAVKKGENDNVKVTLTDTTGVTPLLWAMLHIDAGKIGTYEFPGADVPVKDGGDDIIMRSFHITQ